ncbi:MAG: AAA family ATPase [Verrucomicrobiales bacterium]
MRNDSSKFEQKALKLLPELLKSAFDGNDKRLESITATIIRTLRDTAPELAQELVMVLAEKKGAGAVLRSTPFEPSPVDQDSNAPLLRIEPSNAGLKPFFAPALQDQINRLIRERQECAKLIAEGLLPPRSLLIKGPPGTGKTMLARFLSSELSLKFVTLDLATSISSFLGKTGMNLRRAFDYARATPCLLLLDEFDAVAKRRDDSTEVGELKRIVNVLLKELEDWPASSLMVAATNHPELLDPAIGRRFDRTITTGLPEVQERHYILLESLGRFGPDLDKTLLSALAAALTGKSGSDVHSIGVAAVRRHVVEQFPLDKALITELRVATGDGVDDSKSIGELIRTLQHVAENKWTVRELAEMTSLAPSTVHYHLHKT